MRRTRSGSSDTNHSADLFTYPTICIGLSGTVLYIGTILLLKRLTPELGHILSWNWLFVALHVETHHMFWTWGKST